MTAVPAVFEMTFTVQPDDIDALGHVNNVVYLRWVQEVAAAHWFAAAPAPARDALAWVVTRHEIDYRHPAVEGDPVVARTWVADWSGVTSDRRVELRHGTSDRVLAQARTVWCAVDRTTGRPRRFDPDLARAFQTEGPGREHP